MSWIHRVVFGGNGDDVTSGLETSYQQHGSKVSSVQTDETCMTTIESERGWGHDQTTVMNQAYLDGKISWWQRWTESR